MLTADARLRVAIAGIIGALAVAAGAYAVHGLAAVRDAHAVGLWQTASQYQLMHVAAAVATTLGGHLLHRSFATLAGWLFLLGAVLFGGALYGLGWWGPSALGAVAPLGGFSFILGWLFLAAAAVKAPR
ncbi:DUF423 domain-containing protein [Nitrospirillum amazonense]|uniref:Uncharacterized membrane protein YgdD (TMEM256/DUF423 family) n=1 Tax=Nitrospirillum amazonense TaxID=28077 RepID=A0A560JA90_9PROT|nr:DUF423 domain-containing protein [Nitrospirillum amazonense]MDG3440982.1 DUF423 domain-containing protein [Nitrospirillum amazonense]TWB67966.1 uncharacterized membrane protein YgdD (TMEM256/DUF423 family) [Nitrospirillum amazonense]